MSGLKHYSYPGWGTWAKENSFYSQAIRVGDRIVCSGQGGWDPTNENVDFEKLFPADVGDQIDQAFKNCDHNLKHAGGKGFSQVYKVTTYSTDVQAQFPKLLENMKKWGSNPPPVWTLLGVKELGAVDMHFEIDVEAYDPEGAAEAHKSTA